MIAERDDDVGREAPLRRSLGVARPEIRSLTGATLLGSGAIGASIGLLATSAWLISRASQHPQQSALALAIVAVQVFGISRGLFRYSERLAGHHAAFRLLADVRVRVVERLERLAPAGLPAFRHADLLTRLVHDVDSMQDLLLRVLQPFAIAALVGIGTVVIVALILPSAAAVLLVALVVAATLVPWLTRWSARRAETMHARARAKLTESVVDLLEGAADLAAYGATQGQLARAEAADEELTHISRAGARTAGLGLGLAILCSGLAMWGALVVGIPAVASGRLAGVMLAVLALIPLAAFELAAPLPLATQALERSRRSAARVFEVMDTPDPVVEPAAAPVSIATDRTLRVRQVRARYPGRDAWALDGVDLDLPYGKRLAIVGASGSGKSTLASVLLRFLPYEEGSVTLGGVELNALAGDDVRRVVGLVAQDAHIFDATVAENLRLARPSATDVELRAVLDRVGLRGWVEELPAGLGTAVGEHGATLSGGEHRRLVLARALLAEFPVLVLDEPTEHLDPASADTVAAELIDAALGRTIVLITHRLMRLDGFDEVVVLERGRVAERGTHAELMTSGGSYAAMWSLQRNVEDPHAATRRYRPNTSTGARR